MTKAETSFVGVRKARLQMAMGNETVEVKVELKVAVVIERVVHVAEVVVYAMEMVVYVDVM